MVVQLFIAGLMVSLCAAADIKFPADGKACILIKFESNNSLSWTPKNGSEMAIPNWNISNPTYEVTEGNCTDTPYVMITFKADNATMRFDFKNASGNVDVDMTLTFVPEIVFSKFNNTDSNSVSISTSLMTGPTDKAFLCNAEQSASGKDNTDEYDLTLRLMKLEMQGYGVENDTFSKDIDECPADQTTTAEPTTEPTIKPVTSVAPPTTAPKVTLNATDETKNITCAMMTGKFTFMIPYNTSKGIKTANVVIPKDVKTDGSECTNENMTDTLMAKFGRENFMMAFVFRGDKDNIWLDEWNATIVYDEEYFPDVDSSQKDKSANFTLKFNEAFKAKKDGSYLCDSDTTTDLSGGLKLKTTDFQYTALSEKADKFSDKDVAECSADAKTSSIVPIAVGAALAGLVVIVLIAYLIGRRRNRKGYESV